MLSLVKPKRVLSDKQLSRAKTSLAILCGILTVQGGVIATTYWYNGDEYEKMQIKKFERGQIVEYTNLEEFCNSWILLPGITTLSRLTLAIMYLFWLFWMFLGMNIIADIFMGAIEQITSAKRIILKLDPSSGDYIRTKVNVWNPTVANLTLMALGSSAPEILLNVIETVSALGDKPGELGPSTIVGSAAFNFLIISGISIYAVNETNDDRTQSERQEAGTPKGVKKVADTGVFAITTCWSIIAYVWLYVVLLDGVVKDWEAYLTLGFFFLLILMAYIADCLRRKTIADRETAKYGHEMMDQGATIEDVQASKSDLSRVQVLDAYEFYKKLLPIEAGEAPEQNDDQMTTEMKEFLLIHFGTTRVSEIDKDQLKSKLDGPALIERISHRKAVAVNYKREAIAKYTVLHRQNKQASILEDHQRNANFGFSCLHYSVSEAAGSIKVKVLNKTKKPGKVRVRTVDGDAEATKDYIAIDTIVSFTNGQAEGEVAIKIIDDDSWEPDEDFYVELVDPQTAHRLVGQDTRTRITIIDDDKPGMLVFQEKKVIRHPSNERICYVVVQRDQGTDGNISVKYKTVPLGSGDQKAREGIDYEHVSDTLTFLHQETSKQIAIKILDHEDPDEERDEIFGLKLYDAEPSAVKISKKDTAVIQIVTDDEKKKQAEALTQLMNRIQHDEKITWAQQFKDATMLHPTLNENGEVEDISAMDAVLHFFSIGWKVLFAICPPPHMGGGKPCFVVAICFIGALTAVVGEVAGAMGCVMGLKPGVTAITFVAIGTSLPDTFASMTAARDSPNADSAVGNITGSNSVNVFLGLGLPWVIAVIYSGKNNEEYKVPAKGLDLSVVLFLSTCLVGVAILIFRRCTVKGELGGSPAGRLASAIVFISLWVVYIVCSTLGQYGYISISSDEESASASGN